MALWRVPRNIWLARVLRRHRLDRNPLRRGYDRAETAVFGVLLVAFLAGAPFAAYAAGSVMHTASAREQQAQRAVLRQVPAILLQAATPSSGYATTLAARDVTARWRSPDGRVHTGLVSILGGAAAGSTIMVWINRAGLLNGPPLQGSQIATRANLAALCTIVGLAIVLATVGWLTRRMLDRRRLAAWDAAWQATGPGWTPRR
jgi:hypothetical protein